MVYLYVNKYLPKLLQVTKIISQDGMKKRKTLQQRTEQSSLVLVPPMTKIIFRLFIVSAKRSVYWKQRVAKSVDTGTVLKSPEG